MLGRTLTTKILISRQKPLPLHRPSEVIKTPNIFLLIAAFLSAWRSYCRGLLGAEDPRHFVLFRAPDCVESNYSSLKNLTTDFTSLPCNCEVINQNPVEKSHVLENVFFKILYGDSPCLSTPPNTASQRPPTNSKKPNTSLFPTTNFLPSFSQEDGRIRKIVLVSCTIDFDDMQI